MGVRKNRALRARAKAVSLNLLAANLLRKKEFGSVVMEGLVSTTYPEVDVGKKTILVNMPVRGRREKALENWHRARAKVSGKHNIVPVFVSDPDDPEWEEAPEGAFLLRQREGGNKITAHNHAPSVMEGWDVVVCVADDQECVEEGWDDIIVRTLYRYFPDGDGALTFGDGASQGVSKHVPGLPLCTQCVLGKNYFDRFGYVYEWGYKSYFADNEFTLVAHALKRLRTEDRVLFRHNHPIFVTPRSEMDEVFQRNDTKDVIAHDKAHFESRFAADRATPLEVPRPVVSVVIVTSANRTDFLEERLREWEGVRSAFPGHYELVVVRDAGELRRGLKRQIGVEAANGRYICHADDDDPVPPRWGWELIQKVQCGQDVECFEVWGRILTRDGKDEVRIHHSIEHDGWTEEPLLHKRCPNHINPIRRDLVLRVGFNPELDVGEDKDFSYRMRPLLKKEGKLSEELLWYRPSAAWHGRW